MPAGYSVADAQGGFGFVPDESEKGLWLVFAIGLALVILSVAIVFDSVWAAWMVFLAIPLALAGVIAAFWAAKAGFTREAAVGVILVVGLAVNQAILLIDAGARAPRVASGGDDVARADGRGGRARGREPVGRHRARDGDVAGEPGSARGRDGRSRTCSARSRWRRPAARSSGR